ALLAYVGGRPPPGRAPDDRPGVRASGSAPDGRARPAGRRERGYEGRDRHHRGPRGPWLSHDLRASRTRPLLEEGLAPKEGGDAQRSRALRADRLRRSLRGPRRGEGLRAETPI